MISHHHPRTSLGAGRLREPASETVTGCTCEGLGAVSGSGDFQRRRRSCLLPSLSLKCLVLGQRLASLVPHASPLVRLGQLVMHATVGVQAGGSTQVLELPVPACRRQGTTCQGQASPTGVSSGLPRRSPAAGWHCRNPARRPAGCRASPPIGGHPCRLGGTSRARAALPRCAGLGRATPPPVSRVRRLGDGSPVPPGRHPPLRKTPIAPPTGLRSVSIDRWIGAVLASARRHRRTARHRLWQPSRVLAVMHWLARARRHRIGRPRKRTRGTPNANSPLGAGQQRVRARYAPNPFGRLAHTSWSRASWSERLPGPFAIASRNR